MKSIKKLKDWYKGTVIAFRNSRNKKRLTNDKVSLICSNCTGGFIYHWLGMEFRSPFINLCMSNEDFLTAMENLDEFLSTPIKADVESEKPYPVGIGYGKTKIHFMHYPDFETANKKWEDRKKRIDRGNMAVMLCDICPDDDHKSQLRIIERFDKLPFAHKIIFTDNPYPDYSSAIYLPLWTRDIEGIFQPVSRVSGKRPIDDFDFVGYINSIKP